MNQNENEFTDFPQNQKLHPKIILNRAPLLSGLSPGGVLLTERILSSASYLESHPLLSKLSSPLQVTESILSSASYLTNDPAAIHAVVYYLTESILSSASYRVNPLLCKLHFGSAQEICKSI